jgi:hypothetical protein
MKSHATSTRRRPWVAGILMMVVLFISSAAWAGKVEDLARSLLIDPSFKVRVQAALLLGKLGDKAGTDALIRALNDENKSVRAMAAQSLGKLGGLAATGALRALLQREQDSFVTTQAKLALSGLEDQENKDRKVFVTIGPFTGGVRLADSTIVGMLQASLRQSLQKIPQVTFKADAPAKGRGKNPQVGFLVDGNVSRLDEAFGEGETNCEIKLMVARWPSKSIILWTSAGAAVHAGRRENDKVTARRECIEATAGQLGESLMEFFRSQGG